MSSRLRVIVAAPIALTALGLAAAPASAATGATEIVQHVTATYTSQLPTPHGFVASADVSAGGRKIATEVLSCTGSRSGALRCDFTLAYARGLVSGHLASPAGSRRIDGTITGGTRYYAGATGSVSGRATPTGAVATIRLTLPAA